MDALPAALAPLGAWGQFVAWFAWPKAENPAKLDKFPCHARTGAVWNAHDPAGWGDFATAAATAKRLDRGHGSGVGFVFTAADPFFFHDIDECGDGHGNWAPLAHQQCARFAGAAVEVSVSGRGLHIIGIGPQVPHRTTGAADGIKMELYTSGRFVALTGIGAQGNAAHDCSAALIATVAQYFPPAIVPDDAGAGWTDGPVAEWSGPADDDELIRKMLAAAGRQVGGAFGDAVTVEHLWTANPDKLAHAFPDPHGPYDASRADQALANHLAWWTGKDCERIERLMRRSALAREKWDSPHHVTYLRNTILKAARFVTSVAQLGVPQPVAQAATAEHLAAAEAAGVRVRNAADEFMPPVQQLAHFEGCTFISELERIYSVKRNKLFKREAFDVEYGGHVFQVDPLGTKTTDSAWLALTRSRVNVPPIVDEVCFRPELPAGAVVREAGFSLINTYQPYECRVLDGDPTPWLRQLSVMIPLESDRRILLEYLARHAQRPGVKIPWWPVIQGTKGNGKTMIGEVMEYMSGERYTHRPNAAALARDGMKFNSWIFRKTCIFIDEVSLGNRRDFLEELKPIVTGQRIPIEGKGVDALTGDNRANGIVLTNHKDGVPIDDDERRYCIFFTAQQRKRDLRAHGLTEEFFDSFRAWFYADGLPIIAHFLKSYVLPAQLPSRAPETSSTREAIRASLGRAEQEVLEAIEEGRPGFCGGWVSSKYLDALLDGAKAAVPRNKRRDMMQRLGYDWHPALTDGRVTETVTPDNGKPKLYLRDGHLALNVQDPSEVARMYSKAQGVGAATGRAA